MKLPDEILDQAFAIYEEFGPDRRIDRRERLQTQFPQLSAQEIEDLIGHMQAVSSTVWDLARKGGEIKLGEEQVRQALQAVHPFLQAKGLEKALFLVNYFAWHDGFDT